MTPTQRTLAYLRKLGHTAVVVERWNPHAHIRQDLFGFIDVLSVNGSKVCGWQATSGDHVAHRLEKMAGHPNFPAVSEAISLFVIGWRKVGERGKRKLWEPRIVPVLNEKPMIQELAA